MSLQNRLEALLFSSGKAMGAEQLAEITGEEKRKVTTALKALQKAYGERDTSLKLFNEGSDWKILVKDEYIELVRRIVADTELSKATLETLAIIAYNQPKVLQSKVVELRGGNAYEHIGELLELGFITKQKEGRSFSIRLTEKFYDYFDVEGSDSIRKVFKDIAVPLPKEAQQHLGDLDVVDVLPEEEKRDANGLEVVEEFPDAPGRLEVTEEEKQERTDFLSKIEEQIDSLTSKNNEREQDDDFKPQGLAEEGGEGESEEPEASSEEAGEESERPADDAGEEKDTEKPDQA